MIRGLHGLIYTAKDAQLRAFFRDKLKLPYTDVGDGWLIFDAPSGDFGVHPRENDQPREGTFDLSFFCDDIGKTVADLESRGVEFTGPVEDHGYGLVTYFLLPGGTRMQLYEPRYEKRSPRAKAARKVARAARAVKKVAAQAKKKKKAGSPRRL